VTPSMDRPTDDPSRGGRTSAARSEGAPFPFIIGTGRCGTTLLRAMLDAHSEMAIPGESQFIAPMARRWRRRDGPRFDYDRFLEEVLARRSVKRWGLSPTRLRSAFAELEPEDFPAAIRGLYRVYADDRGKPRYADKTPIHIHHVALLARLFPESTFIHLIRDGRDVALSYLDQPFGPKTVDEIAFRWVRAVRRGQRAGELLGPGRYREVRYAQLVDDPADAVRDLCPFVQLAFEPRMLRYFDDLAPDIVGSQHHQRLLLPPTRGLRDWRRDMHPDDQLRFESLAGDLLGELGYERSTDAVPRRVRVRSRITTLSLHARRAWGRRRN
jgi:Sulfotransferase family